ncbi:radical SAM protein [Pyxidicoccus trucidator]|uniref:radical SAM protein n=1 Tax=Pyxidicoccus trucidator TaxID=2709662 RepID=UPI0013DD6E7F|nr:radical SAM protein [Pyxidicoccus trucidator]
MAPSVGVAGGHNEVLFPGNPGCEKFFTLLEQERLPRRLLDGRLTSESLDGLELLLLGGPRLDLEREEARAISDWVEAGGSLLITLDDVQPGQVLASLFDGLVYTQVGGRVGKPHSGWWLDPIQSASPVRYEVPLEPGVPADRKRQRSVIQWRRGAGAVCVFSRGSRLIGSEFSAHFASWLVTLWRHRTAAEVARRRALPQRHRLLQGYPMAPQLRKDLDEDRLAQLDDYLGLDAGKPCVVGVLPHPFCNPAVKGCGFCTFPQEAYRNTSAEQVAAEVAQELRQGMRWGRLTNKPVEALYFGGGTANLTPPESFRELCRAARAALPLAEGAEVTLEGVPIYFSARKPSLLEVLREELPDLYYRISMGIQTFDDAQLARMGRTAIGGPVAVEKAVLAARDQGFSCSGDLLFNLPGQSREQMLADVDRAIDLGLDQVCVYHLVLFEGLGTEWSKQPALLAALPSNTEACANWLAVRERLLEQGFVQTTLTNFERASLRGTPRSFRYEPYGFSPETYDVFGFGPAALNIFDAQFGWLKTANPEGAGDYLAARARGRTAERMLLLGGWDKRLLYLTRKVALLGIDSAAYRAWCKTELFDDFGRELTALLDAGLLAQVGERLELTPEGMFYGDTIAGTLAWRRVRSGQALDVVEPNKHRLSYDEELDASVYSAMG